MNPMNEVQISKATVSIGVGEAGEKLSRAITLLEQMFDQTPVKTFSKVTNPEFGIRKRQPIACKLTLRGEKADKAIEMVLEGIKKISNLLNLMLKETFPSVLKNILIFPV